MNITGNSLCLMLTSPAPPTTIAPNTHSLLLPLRALRAFSLTHHPLPPTWWSSSLILFALLMGPAARPMSAPSRSRHTHDSLMVHTSDSCGTGGDPGGVGGGEREGEGRAAA